MSSYLAKSELRKTLQRNPRLREVQNRIKPAILRISDEITATSNYEMPISKSEGVYAGDKKLSKNDSFYFNEMSIGIQKVVGGNYGNAITLHYADPTFFGTLHEQARTVHNGNVEFKKGTAVILPAIPSTVFNTVPEVQYSQTTTEGVTTIKTLPSTGGELKYLGKVIGIGGDSDGKIIFNLGGGNHAGLVKTGDVTYRIVIELHGFTVEGAAKAVTEL